MTNESITEKINRVRNALQDDESKYLFDLRLEYAFRQDPETFISKIGAYYHDWSLPKDFTDRKIVIFGCGSDGRISKKRFEDVGLNVFCYMDNDRSIAGTKRDSISVIHPDTFDFHDDQYVYIIASSKYRQEMIEELLKRGIDKEFIHELPYQYPVFTRGTQYFDLFGAGEDEVFIDAGAYDGQTILDFEKWSNGKYAKVYSFEPIKSMFDQISEKNKNKNRIELINAATWSENTELSFRLSEAGSRVESNGDVNVHARTIDSIVGDSKVTFIKMDIEGSEAEALEGARKTINKYKPRLAICLYHKRTDIIDLPDLILQMCPDYKMWIRHYASNHWETVLYARV